MSLPPTPHHPEPWALKWSQLEVTAISEYGELCHKQALEEAYKWMLDRHEAQKHRDNYMLIEANRFKKEMLK